MAGKAFVFPGQGSQYVGMGKDLYEEFPVARDTFDVASDVVGFDLREVCFAGPEETLKETRFTQLAIVVHSVAAWRIADDNGFVPDYVAGHSVGEYSALVAAGALAFEDALRLVRIRAEAMYSAGLEKPGAMAALVGVPEGRLEELLTAAREACVLEPANYNSRVQVVVSGDEAAVARAVDLARSFGVRKAIRLNVSGAFHSSLMAAAGRKLGEALDSVVFSRARIPVIANVTGGGVVEPDEIKRLLARQLTSPVLWLQSMLYLIGHGVRSFVELGPGGVLCGLLKRIEPEVACVSCGDAGALREMLGEVSA
jgi:[acyl-carrier-protein] S-malonyltransferase